MGVKRYYRRSNKVGNMNISLHTVETVASSGGTRLQRMTVPGGWIYMAVTGEGVALTFVPEIWTEEKE